MVDDSTRPPEPDGRAHPAVPRSGGRPDDDEGPGMSFFSEDPDVVRAREQEHHGGTKVGAAFFGWLSAVGLTVLVVGLLGAVAEAAGAGGSLLGQDLSTTGVVLVVVLLLVLFGCYLGGGYVAGRMARFDGWKQGLAVWGWAVVVAAAVGVAGLLAGDRFDVLARLEVLPRLPYTPDELSTSGVVTAVLVWAATLAGALLGGVLGARYHREVDEAGRPASDRRA